MYISHKFPPRVKLASDFDDDEDNVNLHLPALQELAELKPELSQLVRLALRYASTPASSTASERVWSVATRALTAQRRCMKAETAGTQVFLGSNKAFINERGIVDKY